jgi:hypothetical protein
MVSVARADSVTDSARAVAEDYENAVVSIKTVVREKFNMAGFGSDDTETTSEIVGTIIRPDGLTVVAHSDIDPSAQMKDMYSFMDDDDSIDISFEVVSIKIRLESGEEVEANQTLFDSDLDLALLRPKEPLEKPHTFVDMAKPSDVKVLDQVVTLSRLSKVLSRTAAATLDRVQAIVQRPRLLYIVPSANYGTPTFTLDGTCVGIGATKRMSSSSPDDMWDNTAFVVVSAADVAELAEQSDANDKEE